MNTVEQYSARLKGRVAIVTGAGSTEDGGLVGIGRAIATTLAREGANVALVDISHERAMETLESILSEGGQAGVFQGDVSLESECVSVVARINAELGPPSILVNNAGVSRGAGRLESLDTKVWRDVLDVNLSGALYMAKNVIPHTRELGGGSLIHISSIAGILASGAGLPYAASKAGLIAMSRELALTYGRDKVRSNVVMPGHIYSQMSAAMITDELRELRRKVSPLGTEGTPWDVAKAVAFLASDDARYITATCLPVDGGVSTLGAFAARNLMNES
jgi:NAD(P)-dependent dehydrogenase (short-subunit alcohol dehydrogenase family)